MIVRRPPLRDPRRIVVRVPNWIGDCVMSLPALEALRARFPAAEIAVVAKPWVSELYTFHQAVSRVIVYDPEGRHRGWAGFGSFIDSIRRERFDAAVLFQNAFHAAWMAWQAKIPVRVGYAKEFRRSLLTHPVGVPPRSHWGHQVNYYLQLVLRAGLAGKPGPRQVSEIRLALQPAERTWAARRLKELGLDGPRFIVGISPGASFGPAKRWFPERFASLADRLIGALHADVLIFGSGAERPLAEEIARSMEHTPLVVAGETTLRQLMALLSTCRLVVSNDSGAMHLAAALGLPVVAIFGSTDERATGPVSLRARIVKNPVDCSPCGLRECPVDFRCMTGLSVEHVHRTALALVKELGVTHERAAAD